MEEKAIKYLNRDKWYHGTTLFGWYELCLRGVKNDYNIGNELDFGYGFYLTSEQKQAESYISNLLKYHPEVSLYLPVKNLVEKRTPIIIEFTFYPLDWFYENNYNFKFFNKYDDEFAEFVFHNRLNNTDGQHQHNYHIIYGVMSDSLPMLLIQKYKNEEMTKGDVIKLLKKSTSVKQLSLHIQELCDRIIPTKAYYLESGEELNINDYCNR